MKKLELPNFLKSILEYQTPKSVAIPNYTIGAIYRLLQLLIAAYVICWIFFYEKSYQMTDDAVTNVFTKVKGVGFTNFSDDTNYGKRVWDIQDLIVPELEANALFVSTNIVITPNQTLSKCPEVLKTAKCSSDADCPAGYINHLGNGPYTGACSRMPGMSTGTCEIYAWCPLENDTLPLGQDKPMFPMVTDFTLLLKAHASFQEFNIDKRNILDWITNDYLRKCQYNASHEKDKYCPIFKLSTIFKETGVGTKTLVMGGAIAININWDCDFDWNPDRCKPQYSFVRLHDTNAAVSPGFNYRYPRYYQVNGTRYRDLYKVFGIRILINVRGVAGKFHMLPFTLALGAGLQWVGVASIICDIIMTKIVRAREFYDRATTESISKEEEEEYLNALLSKTKNDATEEK